MLHIDVADNECLLKPVKFEFALKEAVRKKGKMIILRDNDDTFEDITDEVFENDKTTVIVSEKYFSFGVRHFSR